MHASNSPFTRLVEATVATRLVVSAALVLTSEPAILATIVSFLPVAVNDNATTTSTTSTATGVLADAARNVVTSMCRAIPGLSRLVGSTNKSFWRAMVLTHFDFTEDPAKARNIKDYDSSTRSCSLSFMRNETVEEAQSQSQRSDCSCPLPDVWDQHPAKPLVDAWEASHPQQPTRRQRRSGDSPHAEFLHRKLHWWSALRTYYRPHEFQFLTDIQRGVATVEAAWPDHEDAFTLLGDLILLLQQLVQRDGRHFQTWSDGEARTDPLLMSRFQLDKNAYEMLAFCDILPHYWSNSDLRVSARWSGFDGSLPVVEKPKRQKPRWSRRRNVDVDVDADVDEDEDWEEVDETNEEPDDDFGAARTTEEVRIFPISRYKSAFQRLRLCVYKSCTDWRRVDVHFEETGSPEFYIGASKLSGRWLGYVGRSQFDPSPQVREPRASSGWCQCTLHG